MALCQSFQTLLSFVESQEGNMGLSQELQLQEDANAHAQSTTLHMLLLTCSVQGDFAEETKLQSLLDYL